MGVFLDDLVRVGLHHAEAALPVVNLGEFDLALLNTDIYTVSQTATCVTHRSIRRYA